MPTNNETNTPPVTEPVFGFLLLGGPLSGALVRDIRLAYLKCINIHKTRLFGKATAEIQKYRFSNFIHLRPISAHV